jgi:hypothetical protein
LQIDYWLDTASPWTGYKGEAFNRHRDEKGKITYTNAAAPHSVVASGQSFGNCPDVRHMNVMY